MLIKDSFSTCKETGVFCLTDLQQHNDTTASLIVPLPKLDGPWVGGNEDGTAQEGSQWSVEDSGE